MFFAPLGVLVPGRLLPREAINQDVGPTVAVEIVSEHQEALGVGVVGPQPALESGNGFFGTVSPLSLEAGIRGSILMPLLESRSLIPKRARDYVHVAVVIEVCVARALGPELVG